MEGSTPTKGARLDGSVDLIGRTHGWGSRPEFSPTRSSFFGPEILAYFGLVAVASVRYDLVG